MAQQHDLDDRTAPDAESQAAPWRARAVAGSLVSAVLSVVALATLTFPVATGLSGASAGMRVALSGALLLIAVSVAALTAAASRRDGAACISTESSVGLALVAAAGALHIAVTGSTAGTLLIAFAISCAGHVASGRRTLVIGASLAWAAWVGAVATALATDVTVFDGRTAVWATAAAGLALACLPAALTLLSREREQRAVADAHREAADRSVIDQTTGAANRQGLSMIARPMIENARRQGQAVHCLYVDLEGFREVNETAGWDAGDRLLAAAAEALRGSTRLTDVVARWSADEFVVLGPGTGTSPLEMERRVRKRLTAACPVPADVWSPRVSVGSSTLVPWDEGDLEDLTRRADEDMHLRRSLRRRSRLAGRAVDPDAAGREGGTAPAVG